MTVGTFKNLLGLTNSWKLISTGVIAIPMSSTYESPAIISLTEPLANGKVYAVEFRIGHNDSRQSQITFFASVSNSLGRIMAGVDANGNIHSVARAFKNEYPNALCLFAPIGTSPIYVNKVWVVKDA